jgi:hypothetical protein
MEVSIILQVSIQMNFLNLEDKEIELMDIHKTENK